MLFGSIKLMLLLIYSRVEIDAIIFCEMLFILKSVNKYANFVYLNNFCSFIYSCTWYLVGFFYFFGKRYLVGFMDVTLLTKTTNMLFILIELRVNINLFQPKFCCHHKENNDLIMLIE